MKRKITTLLLVVAILAGFALVSIPAAAANDPWQDMERNILPFTYEGEAYTLLFGIYEEEDGVGFVGPESGSAWPVGPQELFDDEGELCSRPRGPYAVTIFQHFGEQEQQEVDPELRAEIIRSVSFSGEDRTEALKMFDSVESEQADGRWYAYFYLYYNQSEALFHANVTLADGCSDANGPITGPVRVSQHIALDIRPDDVWIDCEEKGLTDQQSLQAYLDDLQEHLPLAYSQQRKVAGLCFRLGAYDYGDIVLRDDGLTCNHIQLEGAAEEDANGIWRTTTQMSSLVFEAQPHCVMSNIKFTGEGSGIGVDVSAGRLVMAGCSFDGYDTGVRVGENAILQGCTNSLFQQVDTAIAVDCTNYPQGEGFDIHNCAFLEYKLGVDIEMDEQAIAYYYRIYHCDFINGNSGNRDIRADGKVYAFGNYFDHAKEKNDKVDVSLRYLSPTGLTDYLMYLFGYSEQFYPAPVWDNEQIGIGAEADHVVLDKNDEDLFENGLLLDSDSFERETDLTMDILGEDGSITGTWIFECESEEEE